MGPDRLYGWQEIAQYLGGISVGTARRYRKRRGLPVYGLPAPKWTSRFSQSEPNSMRR